MNARPLVCITMGDPAGIGPELCLRALREPSVLVACAPVVFGDAGLLKRLESAGLPTLGCRVVSPAEWEASGPTNEPVVIDCAAIEAETLQPGKVSAACGRAAFAYIE